ncbi:MAG: glycerol-3-phosphate dehydrogenase, partial [Rhodobacteraceae bacterium]|nr:glycerol-3-phosphate dehydrogenase [Paracoccaceae bacterium]
MTPESVSDLFIIGGGINGCGIARDAAGRGLTVRLAEMGDLGSATSSASTKLFHGGLRYLEHFEFRLVREALIEREVLLRMMPHISWPMRFVLPHATQPPKRLKSLLPRPGQSRPAWMIRAGLLLYDTLGGRRILPGTRTLDLTTAPEGKPLQERFRKGFEYSDCWVDDARLVVLNARDAAEHGADILTRTKVTHTERRNGFWEITTRDLITDRTCAYRARALINAAGPWVAEILHETLGLPSKSSIRLVRGSHIVTRKLFDHDRSYILLGDDRRVIFAIPYENEFTLIGTTDADHDSPNTAPRCTPAEQDYLIDVVNQHFRQPITREDVIWSYSGVRPLHDDGANDASSVTRDYSFELDTRNNLPALSVFGGKITTYRRLAEN